MARKRNQDSPPGPDVDVQDPPVEETPVETTEPEPEVEPAEPAEPQEEAKSTLTLSGKAEAVRRAARRIGSQPSPSPSPRNGDRHEPEEDDTYNDTCGELMADGRNKLIVVRTRPKKYEGLKVRPVAADYLCPMTKAELERQVFEDFGGECFHVSIYPNVTNAESKPPLGAFTITNKETDEPWEPQDDEGGEPLPTGTDPDPYKLQDRSPSGTAKRVLEEEAAHLEGQIQVKRLRKTLKAVERDGDEVENDSEKDGLRDRLHQIEERSAIAQVESRMDKKMDAVLATLEKLNQPRGSDPMIEFMKMMSAQQERSSQQTMKMMETMFAANRQPKEDAMEQLEKLARLKSLFGGEDEKYGRLIDMALDKLFDDDKRPDANDDSDIKYAINKMEPLFQKLVDRGIQDTGKTKAELTTEQIKAIQLEAATKVARELEEKWTKEGLLVKAPALPAPGKPGAPAGKSGGRSDMTVPPSPDESGYDRKKAVNFVLDVAIHDMKSGCPDNSFLVWDIVDGLDSELLEQFSKVESGAQLDSILSAWGDPEKIAEVKKVGADPLPKTWLSRVVTTAQTIILKKKSEGPPAPAK